MAPLNPAIALSTVLLLTTACGPGSPPVTPNVPDPVLSTVLLPGSPITFARLISDRTYEALPTPSFILRMTSPWPLDGERVEVTVSPFTGPGSPAILSWVRSDDTARKQQLASAGYIETVVDGFGYSIIVTPSPALQNGTGINLAIRTSQGGTVASPAARSNFLSAGVKPRVNRTLPSAVFFDCAEVSGRTGTWMNGCKNSSSIVARNIVLEGWVISPRNHCYGEPNDPICVEDWHYEFRPDPDFIEQMYGPNGALAALGDRTLQARLLHGNPPGAPANDVALADLSSSTGQSLGITVNSFVLPDNRTDSNPLTSDVKINGELNAWHDLDQESPLCGRYLGFCRHWIGRGTAPAGWTGLTASAYVPAVDAAAPSNTFWPYDPRLLSSSSQGDSLRDGEYVRLAGTLWQDTDHGGVRRWTDHRPAFGGWLEIHPVDWIVRSTPPTTPKTLRIVETINWVSTRDSAETRTLVPNDTMPTGGVLRCRELIDARMTRMPSVLAHSTAVNDSAVVVQTTVSRSLQSPTAQPGRFKATYILWWEKSGTQETTCRQG